MQSPARRFSDPLLVLLAKQSWEVDVIAAELAAARQALQQHEHELEALHRRAGEANASLAQLRAGGAMLDLDRQRRLITWRDAQDDAMAAKQAQIGAVREQCERIVQQLTRARRRLQGYEAHSDRLRRAHREQAARVEAREADDAWLLLRRVEEPVR